VGRQHGNKFRIIGEIIRNARERVGEYPILAKINAYEKSKDGIRMEEAVKISRYLEHEGCDGIEVPAELRKKAL
jgi:2,4-dienoyl-CoA reductase-like NADH-dependent reductase (Old Yellow Enzyme family)